MTDHDTIVAMARAMAEADGVPVGAMGPACVFGGVDYLAIARRHLAAQEVLAQAVAAVQRQLIEERLAAPPSVSEAARVLRAQQSNPDPTDQPALPLPKKKGLKK